MQTKPEFPIETTRPGAQAVALVFSSPVQEEQLRGLVSSMFSRGRSRWLLWGRPTWRETPLEAEAEVMELSRSFSFRLHADVRRLLIELPPNHVPVIFRLGKETATHLRSIIWIWTADGSMGEVDHL